MTRAYKTSCLPEGYCKLAIAARNYLSDRELFEIEGKLVFTDDLEAYLEASVGTACCCDVFDSHAAFERWLLNCVADPFPLSNQREVMKALDVHCGVGIAHNGIIRLTSDPDEKEYSDTAIFIADYLSQIIGSPSDLHDPDVLETIRCLIGSKMAILDGSGYIATVGQFFNERGLLYSNLYHRSTWGF